MGFWEHFPYTNFHNLNLDWIMKNVKIAVDQTNVNEHNVTELRNYVVNYFNNLDVSDEINAKLEDMAASGELENIIASYINTNAVISFPNVAAMVASASMRAGSTCNTLGFHTINDGGGALYYITNYTNDISVNGASIIAMENENLVAVLVSDVANIRQYGAKADAAFDNTAILNIALNSGFGVVVPNGNYGVDGTVNVDNMGSRKISGIGRGAGGAVFYMGTAAKFIVTIADVVFENVRFIGKTLEHSNGQYCIIANPNDGLNADLYIENCIFSYFEYPITINGRGLQMNECLFVVCGDCITYNYVGTSDDGNPVTNKITGGRALSVTDTRFHAITPTRACVKIKAGSVVFNPLIDSCQFDAGVGTFFDAEGDVYGGIISNNVLTRCQAIPFIISSDICNGLKIIDNNIFNYDGGDGFVLPSQILRFEGGTVENCDLSGNNVRGSTHYGFVFTCQNLRGTRISDNIFDTVCTSSLNGVVYASVAATGCQISNNILSDTVNGVSTFINGSSARPFARCVITGNVKPSATTVAPAGIVPPANNTVQDY